MKKFFKKKGNKIKLIIGIVAVIAVIIILLVLYALLIHSVRQNWQSGFLHQMQQTIPVPIAKVNSDILWYSDYYIQLQALENFYKNQADPEFDQIPSHIDLQKMVIEERMIEDVLVRKIAADYNIVVSQAEIDQVVDEIVANQGSLLDVELFLKNYYNITLDQYKKYYIEPGLYYDKTNESIANDPSINKEAQDKIMIAFDELNAGEKFEDLANKYNDLEYLQKDGHLGSFFRGDLPYDLEKELFAMEIGENTNVKTMPDSFQIIKLEDKNTELGVLTLKIIGTKITNIDDFIVKEKENANINIYIY